MLSLFALPATVGRVQQKSSPDSCGASRDKNKKIVSEGDDIAVRSFSKTKIDISGKRRSCYGCVQTGFRMAIHIRIRWSDLSGESHVRKGFPGENRNPTGEKGKWFADIEGKEQIFPSGESFPEKVSMIRCRRNGSGGKTTKSSALRYSCVWNKNRRVAV